MLAGSSLCARANARAGEFADWAEVYDDMMRVQTAVMAVWDSDEAQAKFQELLENVEASVLAGWSGEALMQVRTLRPGELVVQELGPEETRQFCVPLPSRTAEVCLNLSRSGGGPLPAMYAGFGTTRPSEQDHEFEADAGEISFRHEAEAGRPRLLHVCITAHEEACEFRLRCAVRRPEEEAPAVGYSVRRRVEERLAQLRSDPAELEARVRAAKEHQRRKLLKLREGGRDFEAVHRAQLEERRPSRFQEHLMEAAQLKAQRMSQAALRREEVERDQEERAQRWAQKEEEWRREREQQALIHAERVGRPRQLLEKLLTVAFAQRLLTRTREAKVERLRLKRHMRASTVIQRMFLRAMTTRRRRQLYRNVIHLRVALATFARVGKIALVCAAQPRVQWLLTTHSPSDGVPDMNTLIKGFLRKVRYVQHAYRRIRCKLQARVEALLDHFTAAAALKAWEAEHGDSSAYRPVIRRTTKERASAGANSQRARGGSGTGQRQSVFVTGDAAAQLRRLGQQQGQQTQALGAVTAAPPAPARGSYRRSSSESERRNTRVSSSSSQPASVADTGDPQLVVPAFVRDCDPEAQEDLIPRWLRIHALREHVREMQRAQRGRMKHYLELKKANQVEDELAFMGMGNKAHVEAMAKLRPRPVELSRMPGLYAETYEALVNGGFKSLFFFRKRVLAKVFTIWSRIHRNIDVAHPHEKVSGDPATVALQQRASNGRTVIARLRSQLSPIF